MVKEYKIQIEESQKTSVKLLTISDVSILEMQPGLGVNICKCVDTQERPQSWNTMLQRFWIRVE